MADNTKEVLAERGSRYGKFEDNARITQELYNVYKSGPSFVECSKQHDEAMHMIFHKISRMVCGDPYYEDNLVDIIGYAQLLLDIVKESNAARKMLSEDIEDIKDILSPKEKVCPKCGGKSEDKLMLDSDGEWLECLACVDCGFIDEN